MGNAIDGPRAMVIHFGNTSAESISGRHHMREILFITFDRFCSGVLEAASTLYTFYTVSLSFSTLVIAPKPNDAGSRQEVPNQDS